MKIRTLIVDDMLLARERIKRYLIGDGEIEIIGECADGGQAVKAIRELRPDLVFLDVQMPEMDGFEVLSTIGEAELPAVIFITAYDQFALKAFEVHALDYLLKPFDRDRLEKALTRAKNQFQRGKENNFDDRLRALLTDLKTAPKCLKRLAIKGAGHTLFVLTDEIDWIEAAGNYLALHLGKETQMYRERLSQLEAKLDPEKFVRIHRSTIVNIDRIKELHPLFNGDQRVILRDGAELTLSRTYRDKLFALFGES